MNSKEFVKKFTDINIKNMCEKYNIPQSNLSSGTAAEEKYDIIREEIEKEISNLYNEIAKDIFIKHVKGN